MKFYKIFLICLCSTIFVSNINAEETIQPTTPYDQYRLAEYIEWYPAIEQERMMNKWLEKNKLGTWSYTGLVGADDKTVITPQADVNYGYNWFNISDGPIVIELPAYKLYSSISIFDMDHYVEDVIVNPSKPIVVRLANQQSPVEDAYEVVLSTNKGLALLRMVIPVAKDEKEVVDLAKSAKTKGGDGTEDFIIPDFTEKERENALKVVKSYAMKVKEANKLFGKRSQGVGNMDRASGVFLGQLGIPAKFVQYKQYVQTEDGKPLGKDGSYEITIDAKGLMRDEKGYWSITVYNMEDRYLIENDKNIYSITSYTTKPNKDGSFTVRINPTGEGENAIPTMNKSIYAIMRVYQPNGVIKFPSIKTVK
ncbi:MAG: DUF1214 domain-containing protein [Lentisphaeria bacterium]|nr:DUF1214 domain-containing protein [Lentisphaeria bacterium]